MRPTVSVVIPTCNRDLYLRDAIGSSLSQSYGIEEVIVADNGDVPVCLVENDPRLRLIHLPPRSGASRARNEGAKVARGDVIAFLDDDDWWDVDFVRNAIRAMLDSEADIVFGRKDIFIDGVQQRYKSPKDEDITIERMLVRNPGTGGQNLIVKRDAFLDIGGFDVGLPASNDIGFVLDALIKNKKIKCCEDAIAVLRDHGEERLRDNPARRIPFVIKYRRYMPFGVFSKKLVRMIFGAWRYRISMLIHRIIN